MRISDESPWDRLSDNEARLSQVALDELDHQPWAHKLIAKIKENGGIVRNNKGYLFELRFAHALFRQGIEPRYEISGEGDTTLDFGFTSRDQAWSVELMRLEETAAVQESTRLTEDADGVKRHTLHLYTGQDEGRHSPEGETIKAVQRVCQKCEKDGRPVKFPVPNGAYHVLLVDFRNWDGADFYDFIQIGLGAEYVEEDVSLHRWTDENLVSGVFNLRTSVRGAKYARQRLHFIGFVNEKVSRYDPSEFGRVTTLIANPRLLRDASATEEAIKTWPLPRETYYGFEIYKGSAVTLA